MASSASAVMQTFCGTSVTRSRSGLTQFSVPSGGYVLPIKRNVVFKVRSMAEQQEGESTEKKSGAAPPRTNFSDVLAFSGPAPERINGRLAMIGFVAAIGVELANGQDIFSQVQDGGFPLFLGTSILLSMASLIPLFKGVTVESKSGNLMTSDAELLNGRFAMLGLVALAFTEFVKGGALVLSPGPPITGLSAMCGSKSRDVPELVRVCSLFILLAPKGAYYHGTYNTKLLHPPSKILQHLAAPPRIRTPHPGGH